MEIEETGKLNTFETMPMETTMYLSAIYYSSGLWCGGPSGMDKQEVIKQLGNYTDITRVRIYYVKLPLFNVPSA